MSTLLQLERRKTKLVTMTAEIETKLASLEEKIESELLFAKTAPTPERCWELVAKWPLDARYFQERRRCSRSRQCRPCDAGGLGHGPYWFASVMREGKPHINYIGSDERYAPIRAAHEFVRAELAKAEAAARPVFERGARRRQAAIAKIDRETEADPRVVKLREIKATSFAAKDNVVKLPRRLKGVAEIPILELTSCSTSEPPKA